MTMALSAISSHRDTKAMDNPHRRMILNDVLNAFYGGCLDEDCFLGETCIFWGMSVKCDSQGFQCS